MIQREFKVAIAKKNLVAFLCLFLVVELVLAMMIFFSDYIILGTVLALVLFLICFVAILATMLFSVKVSESTIRVRTRFGRQYKFSCSDIDKVICFKRNSVKYGPSFYITLLIESHKLELEIEGTMVGFEKMAGYILEKYESSEIKHTAVSESSKRILWQYKNGDIFRSK